MKHDRWLLMACLFAVPLIISSATCGENPDQQQTGEKPAAERKVHTYESPSGVQFGSWGELPTKPAPTLIVLGSTIQGTLGDPYFRQAGNILGEQGYLVVSLDLPCHGTQQKSGEPREIEGWTYRCQQGADFVAENNRRLTLLLDHLVETRKTDPEQIAVCGTSRGGFLALHFAAQDARVKCVAAYAPVTDLAVLREFQGAKENALVQALDVHRQAKKLAGRAVWIVMGDRDERVGTDQAISLARRITQAALAEGVESRVDLHILAEPKGHTTPAGSSEQSARWILQQFAPAP